MEKRNEINEDQKGCRLGLKPAPDVSWYCYWEGGAWFEQV